MKIQIKYRLYVIKYIIICMSHLFFSNFTSLHVKILCITCCLTMFFYLEFKSIKIIEINF